MARGCSIMPFMAGKCFHVHESNTVYKLSKDFVLLFKSKLQEAWQMCAELHHGHTSLGRYPKSF